MRLMDVLLGRTKPKQANLDALFGLSGAAITLDAALGMKSSGEAAVCFKPASGAGFAATATELTELLELAVRESGSTLRVTDDRFGYRWVVLGDPDLEDLVTSAHMANSTLEERGFGPQLLCSVFGFDAAGSPGPPPGPKQRCYLVYLYKRGTFYPFAPLEGERRDNELELRVRGALGNDLPIEPELGRWFALWGIPLG
jgi:hypothetical protein